MYGSRLRDRLNGKPVATKPVTYDNFYILVYNMRPLYCEEGRFG